MNEFDELLAKANAQALYTEMSDAANSLLMAEARDVWYYFDAALTQSAQDHNSERNYVLAEIWRYGTYDSSILRAFILDNENWKYC